MLLLEAQGINYRDPKNRGDEELAQRIIEREGPAILMWALQACAADYNTPGLFHELTGELKDASREYAKEDSLLHQWGEHEMCVSPDFDIDQMEAFEKFLDFGKRMSGNNRAPNIKLSGFKHALKSAFPSIEFAKRTTRPNPNRAYIKGFGYQQTLSTPGDGNVVQFPQSKEK
jgi:hypothetical protein